MLGSPEAQTNSSVWAFMHLLLSYPLQQLLRLASIGSMSGLQALVDGYDYKTGDLRPLEVVLPVLCHPPVAESTNSAVERGLTCLLVLQEVGSASSCNPLAAQEFIAAVGSHWASIFAWCQRLIDSAVVCLTPRQADLTFICIGQFLFDLFAGKPMSITLLPDYVPPVELVLRLWDARYNSGRLADLSLRGVRGIAFLIAFWTIEEEDVAQTVVDWASQTDHRMKIFYRSLDLRFKALRTRLQNQELGQTTAEHLLLALGAILTNIAQIHGGSMVPYILRMGTLVHYSECVAQIVGVGAEGKPKPSDETVFSALMHFSEMHTLLGDLNGYFITKLAQMAQGGLIRVIRAALINYPSDSLLCDMACSLINFVAPYLAFPPFLRAVCQSLRGLEDCATLRSNRWWDTFQESLRRSTFTAAHGERYLSHSCDNLEVGSALPVSFARSKTSL